MFHVGNARSTTDSIFERSPFSNPFLFFATAAAFIVHVGALYVPATQFILRVEPVANLETWLRMILVAATILVAMELHKWAHRLLVHEGRKDLPARENALISRLWS